MDINEIKREESRGDYPNPKAVSLLSKKLPKGEVEVSIEVNETVKKNTIMMTELYTASMDQEDGCVYVDFDNGDIFDEYQKKFYSLPQLLSILAELATDKARNYYMIGDKTNYMKYSDIAEEAKGWEDFDLEITLA